MSPQIYNFEVVWMTSGTRGTPHHAALLASNPGLATQVWTAAETGLDGWRNCDRNIRGFWKAERGTRNAEDLPERVLFLEWDALVTCDLRTVFPAGRKTNGIEGANLKMPVADGRSFKPFEEVAKFPRPMQAYAAGLAPLAVVIISAAALDALADPAFDEFYAADIFSEIRLPTILRWGGFEIRRNAALTQVGVTPISHPGFKTPGVYHPVKTGGGQ